MYVAVFIVWPSNTPIQGRRLFLPFLSNRPDAVINSVYFVFLSLSRIFRVLEYIY